MTSLHLSQFRKWLLMSPPIAWIIQRLRELLVGSLRQGPIPQHIAFVMDGNRRYARTHQIETVEGHNLGSEALARILEVCYESGVKVVTIYAFSIENFKRSKYEVDALMDMAKVKLLQVTQHDDLLHRYGARIRFLGQRELVKPDVLEAMDRAAEMTKGNRQATLNICFPYTSRHEITAAIRNTAIDYSKPQVPYSRRQFSEGHIARNIRAQDPSFFSEEDEPELQGHAAPASTESDQDAASTTSRTLYEPADAPVERTTDNLPDPETITAQTLTDHMFTAGDPPLDLLIRTSGVQRLSDFLLWQCHEDTEIVFLDCLWPEFNIWKFLPVMFEWQWKQRKRRSEAQAQQRLKVA